MVNKLRFIALVMSQVLMLAWLLWLVKSQPTVVQGQPYWESDYVLMPLKHQENTR